MARSGLAFVVGEGASEGVLSATKPKPVVDAGNGRGTTRGGPPAGGIDMQAPVTCLSQITLSDETATRNEFHCRYFGLLDPLFLSLLKDPRDLPLVYLQANIVTFLLPAASLVFYLDSILAGVVYFTLLFVSFFERFILMLHFSSHKRIFHHKAGNDFALYALCPFFGVPPGVYYLHHVIMHHAENNHGLDVSETESYHRNSLLQGFLKYWLRFVFSLIVEMPIYAVRTKRKDWALTCLASFTLWLGGMALLWTYVSATGCFFVFLLPHVVGLSAMAFGNYSQHLFIDPDSPGDNYTLSYNCISSELNQTTFNDGYHILHHMYPRLHWSELPSKFAATITEHRENKALTFRNTHFIPVGFLVLTDQIEKLVQDHYVHLDGLPGAGPPNREERGRIPTVGEVAADLRRRLEYIQPYDRKLQ